MPNITTSLLILTVLLVLLPPEAYAFGAGDIPDFAYLNGEPSLDCSLSHDRSR